MVILTAETLKTFFLTVGFDKKGKDTDYENHCERLYLVGASDYYVVTVGIIRSDTNRVVL